MNILFIRNADRFSGSERYNINLFREFVKFPNLKVKFLTNLESFANRASRLGVYARVISWGQEGIGTKRQLVYALIRLPLIVPRYISIIRHLDTEKPIDCVCLQSMTEKIFLTPWLKFQGYKIIWTELGPIYSTQMSQVVTFLYKLSSNFVNNIITISQDTKRDLISGGISSKKIFAIYIGIDTTEFKPLGNTQIIRIKKDLQVPDNSFVVGFLGTVTDEKGIEDFVDVARILLKKHTNFHFIVMGDGPYLSWLKRSLKRLNISKNFTCTGFIEKVTEHLGVIDILFLPTRHYEGLPLAILEAQSMGKVVITSRMGGNPEIITNGINGFFYSRLNRTRIIKQIESLYENGAKMFELSRNARRNIINRFNIRIQAKKIVTFLQTV